MIRVTSVAAQASRCRRALASAGIVGTDSVVAEDQRCRTGVGLGALPPANDVVTFDVTVRHEGTAMRTTAVENANLVIEAHDDKVDVRDQGIRWRSVLQRVPLADSDFVH